MYNMAKFWYQISKKIFSCNIFCSQLLKLDLQFKYIDIDHLRLHCKETLKS